MVRMVPKVTQLPAGAECAEHFTVCSPCSHRGCGSIFSPHGKEGLSQHLAGGLILF